MKIRFAVLATIILAGAAACAQSPTAADSHRRVPAASQRTGEVVDTTTRTGGVAGTGH